VLYTRHPWLTAGLYSLLLLHFRRQYQRVISALVSSFELLIYWTVGIYNRMQMSYMQMQ